MSALYKGEIVDSNLTKNANGGTEQMRNRMLNNIDSKLLESVAIHFSRPDKLYDDVPNILYAHDLSEDPAVGILHTDKNKFDFFVFVSYWQRDQFVAKFNLPYSKCTVIQNAIETEYEEIEKPTDKINFIYHTTPHRGLELAYPIFDELSQQHENIHMNVYSSFGVYGWESRDQPYQPLFDKIRSHPNMTYHGAKSNDEVIESLKQSHIFLYPSIWKETSCIALIEAITCGVFSIYPSYGALPETGSLGSNAGMYDYHEDVNVNATRAIDIAHKTIDNIRKTAFFIEDTMNTTMAGVSPHTLNTFRNSWESAIKLAVNNGR